MGGSTANAQALVEASLRHLARSRLCLGRHARRREAPVPLPSLAARTAVSCGRLPALHPQFRGRAAWRAKRVAANDSSLQALTGRTDPLLPATEFGTRNRSPDSRVNRATPCNLADYRRGICQVAMPRVRRVAMGGDVGACGFQCGCAAGAGADRHSGTRSGKVQRNGAADCLQETAPIP